MTNQVKQLVLNCKSFESHLNPLATRQFFAGKLRFSPYAPRDLISACPRAPCRRPWAKATTQRVQVSPVNLGYSPAFRMPQALALALAFIHIHEYYSLARSLNSLAVWVYFFLSFFHSVPLPAITPANYSIITAPVRARAQAPLSFPD